MNCKMCGQSSEPVFKAKILRKYFVQYFQCSACNFLQTEEPYWLEEAYQNPINLTDTGILDRNLLMAEKSAAIIWKFFDHHKQFLDYAGGYGIFTRRIRDLGFDFFTHDPYTANMIARGFDFVPEKHSIEMITTFESFEHFTNPSENISRILNISKNVFFSTQILPEKLPQPEDWWYFGLEHGQHISFYSEKSLRNFAERHGLNFCTNGSNLHLFSARVIDPKSFNQTLKKSPKILNSQVKKKLKSRTVSDMELKKSELI